MTERIDSDELVVVMAFIISRLRRSGMPRDEVQRVAGIIYDHAQELFEGKPWLQRIK